MNPFRIPDEIDYCIICLNIDHSSPERYLSNKFASRLVLMRKCVPKKEKLENTSIGGAQGKCFKSKDDGIGSSSKLKVSDLAVVGKSVHVNVCVLSQLRRLFLLKHVLQHPLDHVTTEKMMLLVQCPSDWFSICFSCQEKVDSGILAIQYLQRCPILKDYKLGLEKTIQDLRETFVRSLTTENLPDNWEANEEIFMERFGNAATTNFLLSEAEAALEFRRFLHVTSFIRIRNMIIGITEKANAKGENSGKNFEKPVLLPDKQLSAELQAKNEEDSDSSDDSFE